VAERASPTIINGLVLEKSYKEDYNMIWKTIKYNPMTLLE